MAVQKKKKAAKKVAAKRNTVKKKAVTKKVAKKKPVKKKAAAKSTRKSATASKRTPIKKSAAAAKPKKAGKKSSIKIPGTNKVVQVPSTKPAQPIQQDQGSGNNNEHPNESKAAHGIPFPQQEHDRWKDGHPNQSKISSKPKGGPKPSGKKPLWN